eukprot:TRINITY_DN4262_c0_g1_i1.p1 TRINITY_DN4262_c0_g1~~TRINITY_DN4262_c0_g1_i1.p1  ORF type:complete len:176 (-),score=10.99 TRINITY_DN4262_c0_g1_i1:21-548(-)
MGRYAHCSGILGSQLIIFGGIGPNAYIRPELFFIELDQEKVKHKILQNSHSQINNSLDYGIISEEDHLQLHNIFEEHRRLERMKTEKINKILKIKQLQDQLSLGDFRSFQPLPQDESNPKTFPIKKKSVGTFIDFQYTRQQAFINQNRQKSWFGEGNQFSIINQNTASDNYYKIK